MAVAPDGKTLAIIPADGRGVELWDTGRWARRKTLPAPGELVYVPPLGQRGGSGRDVGFTPDGRTLFLRLKNGDLARWDAATGAELPKLVAGTGPVPGWLYAPPGSPLLTPCGNGWVRAWDPVTGSERPVPGRYREDVWLAPAPDGRTLAAGDGSGRIDLLDAATADLVRTLRESGDPVKQLMFAPRGDLLVVGERGAGFPGKVPIRCGVRVLRVRDGAEVGMAGESPSLRVWWVDPIGFTPGGRGVVACFYPRDGRVADVGSGELGPPIRLNGAPAMSPDGRVLATNALSEVALIDPATGTTLRRIAVAPAQNPVSGPLIDHGTGWSADGRMLACAVRGFRVAILDPRAGREVRRFPAHPGPLVVGPDWAGTGRRPENMDLETVQLSADGWWAFTTGSGTRLTVGLWETATGSPVAILDQRSEADHGFFTPAGRAVVSFGESGIGYRWDLRAVLAPDPNQSAEDGWRVAASATDAGAATRAAVGLVTTPAGRALLKEKFPPATADVPAARVTRWVGDLGSPDFATREAAEKELVARARAFEPMLRKAADTTPSPEVKARLARVLAQLSDKLTADELRAARVVRAAELVDGPAARALLRGWAGGAPGAVLTEDATAALARLEQRDGR
ncbi:MAG: polymerase sigma factor [Gemmataceae bacterium]|nr:polymerase sigma factor [Gemmataceae bacterium]